MTRRDASWRAAGASLIGGALVIALMSEGSPLIVILFPVALIGLVLIINGKKVATALRAERRGHCHTAEVIHTQRVRRRRQRTEKPRI